MGALYLAVLYLFTSHVSGGVDSFFHSYIYKLSCAGCGSKWRCIALELSAVRS